MEGTLLWSLIKYRERRGGPMPAQIRGNTPLELGWTIGATVILVVLAAVTFIYLGDIKDPPASGPNGLASGVQVASIDQAAPPSGGGEPLDIAVNGQQYLWRYDHPGGVFDYYEMVVPTNTTVTLKIRASDVQHSWWIPELGGKADAVPGHTNETWFKIAKPGIYKGQCAELCGDNHADMRARVRAVTPEEYQAYIEQRKQGIDEAQTGLAEQRRAREEPATRRPRVAVSGAPVGANGAGSPEVVMHGLRERPRGWLEWLTTTDHKKIGIMYLFLTFIFFIVGGVEALIMRLQLAAPDGTLVTPETYNGLVSMHGTTMIFLFIVPVLAGFGNYFVPLMIGARDMAFPRLNALSFWLLAFGGIAFYASLFFEPPQAGLDLLRAAVRRRLPAERRRGRVDLPDPPHRPVLARGRDQLRGHDPQHARQGHGLGPDAAVHLVDPRLQLPADHRPAGDRRGGHDAAHRPPLRHRLLRPHRAAATRCCGSTCSGSSATPRSTS